MVALQLNLLPLLVTWSSFLLPLTFGGPSLGYSPLSAVLSEHGFVRLFNPCKDCCSLPLSDYLTSDIAGHDIMLATPPQYFAESLQHYLQSRGQSSKATSFCALVNTNHALFPYGGLSFKA